MDVPIVKLTVEQMRHSISMALAAHTGKLDGLIQEELDKVCSEENLRHIFQDQIAQQLKQEVSKACTQAVESAVFDLLWNTEVRDRIRELISKEILKGITTNEA